VDRVIVVTLTPEAKGPVMTTTARTDTHDMIVVHRVFRREFPMAPRLIRAVPAGDVARARVVAGHLHDMYLGLHNHHTSEDDLLWPLLLARVDLDADKVLLMEAQHQKVDALLSRALSLLPEWEAAASPGVRDTLADVYDALWPVLLEHLEAEESEVLPLVAEFVTQAEWNRLGERFEHETPKNRLMLFLGALLEEATPAEAAMMLGKLPGPARLIWRLVGRRAYARRIRAVRGVQ
jgi:iron-sulfur cluster repair protein YtfE (RIC family)